MVASGNDTCPTTPLVEEEENSEPSRADYDVEIQRSPNVLVYTASNVPYFDSVKATLERTLNNFR